MVGYYTIEDLKSKGITVYGKNVLVSKFANIYNPVNLILHDNIRIDDFTIISCKGKVEIFNYVHIGPHCVIACATNIILKNYSGISAGAKLYGGCDDFSGDFMTNPTVPSEFLNVKVGDIILEEHALIGSNSVILPSVILRQGTAVAALSLIKNDTEQWMIYGGVPAKILKQRNRECIKMQMELEGRRIDEPVVKPTVKQTIFITGGSKGIGKSIAVYFKELDYDVIISYNKSVNEAYELNELGIHIYKMDVNDHVECENVIRNILEKFPKIDVLVNNAGIIDNQLFHKMSHDQWTSVVSTNVNSLYNVTHPVIQNMIKNARGKIINISSICGLKGSKGQSNYTSSKHAVIGFTKTLALEYGDKNILVNCICPGLVNTDMIKQIDKKTVDKIVDTIPIKQIIEPIEVAKACEFLVNSKYCTGTILNMDCGMNC